MRIGTDDVVKLGLNDFEEAMAHLGLVFGDPDFAALVPTLYQPTERHMNRNLAVRRHGRIAAIVGLFPIEWVLADAPLRLAGIGGVSVHPDHRGSGLMRLLMDAAMREIAAGGYHAACLGGNRRRYWYWGFEKAGVEASMLITGNSLAHAPEAGGSRPPSIFIVDEARSSDHPDMIALYERLAIRCNRTADDFPRHLRNWRRTPLVARDTHGRVAAYACLDAKNRDLVDCGASSPAAFEAIVRRLVAEAGASVRVVLPMLHDPLLARVNELADDASLIEASNWRIYDWPAVLGALLAAAHRSSPLTEGACVVRVTETAGPQSPGHARTLRLSVDSEPRCTEIDAGPHVTVTASEFLRTLAGPLPTSSVIARGPLAAWRPLPLMIPMQDRI